MTTLLYNITLQQVNENRSWEEDAGQLIFLTVARRTVTYLIVDHDALSLPCSLIVFRHSCLFVCFVVLVLTGAS